MRVSDVEKVYRKKECGPRPDGLIFKFLPQEVNNSYCRDAKNNAHGPGQRVKELRLSQKKRQEIVGIRKNPCQETGCVKKAEEAEKKVHEKSRQVEHVRIQVPCSEREGMIDDEMLIRMVQSEAKSRDTQRGGSGQDPKKRTGPQRTDHLDFPLKSYT